ncbi:MAG: cytochrome c(L), periplasmic [Hyphomicrobium sp.]|jgi:cytochrome c-L
MAVGAIAIATASNSSVLAEEFRNTITGDDLRVLETSKPEGRETAGVKKFLSTGINPYSGKAECLPKGEEIYLTSCSGCHGHLGEGKVGPGLNDAYWTYPKNKTDKGLFETIYGGAQGMMGPHNDLELDEMLHLMAWIRNLYTGDSKEAEWLTEEQKKSFKPFKESHASADGATTPVVEACKISVE